jgi:hypothetical protein
MTAMSQTTMNLTTMIRRTLDRARHLPSSLVRQRRWPLALGTLLLATSTVGVLAATNTPAQQHDVRLSSSSIQRGESVSLTGAIQDPDADDAHTVIIYWDDGSGEVRQKIQLPAGQTVFQASHQYNEKMRAPHIKVVVFDRQLPIGSNDNTDGVSSDTKFYPFQVRTVAPKFVADSIRIEKPGRGRVIVEGDLVDPDRYDSIQVEAAWNDPRTTAPTTCAMDSNQRHFRCEHSYPNIFGLTRNYNIGLRAIDDDGGMANHQTSVRLP